MKVYKIKDSGEEAHFGSILRLKINDSYRFIHLDSEKLAMLLKLGILEEMEDRSAIQITDLFSSLAAKSGMGQATFLSFLKTVYRINKWAASVMILNEAANLLSTHNTYGEYLYAISPQNGEIKEVKYSDKLNFEDYPWFESYKAAAKAKSWLKTIEFVIKPK